MIIGSAAENFASFLLIGFFFRIAIAVENIRTAIRKTRPNDDRQGDFARNNNYK